MFKKAFHLLGIAFLALLFVVIVAPAAFAADAISAVSSTSIDFQSVAAVVLAVLAAALTAVARVGVKSLTGYLETKTGIELDAATRSYLNTALDSAVAWATAKATEGLAGKSLTLDVKNEVVAHAVTYILDRVPDALEHFALTSTDIEQLIEARLSGLFNVDTPPAASAS